MLSLDVARIPISRTRLPPELHKLQITALNLISLEA